MEVAITGATGMIGNALSTALRSAGHRVIPVSRRALPGGIRWNPAQGEIDASAFEGVAAVVHLAGENLAAGRWTVARKVALRQSRVDGTALLSRALAALQRPPAVLVSASAIGYYGATHGDEWLREEVPAGNDFLARLCVDWEAATSAAEQAGIRVVHPRFGLVFDPSGGALGRMLPLFRLGLGGALGPGTQWQSWIAIDDLAAALLHLLGRAELAGPINFVAPTPVRSADFARTLGAVLHRPALLRVPAWALRAALGDMADLTVLASQRVSADALIASGFAFPAGGLEPALRQLLAPPP
jgi:hypothetical protein